MAMKKILALALFAWGGFGLFLELRAAHGDSSKIAAGVGVSLIPIIIGIVLLCKR